MAHSSPFHGLNALIETYGMIPPGSTVLCAVLRRGGLGVPPPPAVPAPRSGWASRLAAAHYNHRLRGEESGGTKHSSAASSPGGAAPPRCDGHELPGVPLMWAGATWLPRPEQLDEAWRRPPGRCATPSSGRPRQSWAADLIATAHTADDNVRDHAAPPAPGQRPAGADRHPPGGGGADPPHAHHHTGPGGGISAPLRTAPCGGQLQQGRVLFPQPPALAGGAGAGGHVPRLRQTDGGDRSPAADRRGLPHRPGGKGGGGLPPPRGDPPPARGSGGGSA